MKSMLWFSLKYVCTARVRLNVLRYAVVQDFVIQNLKMFSMRNVDKFAKHGRVQQLKWKLNLAYGNLVGIMSRQKVRS